MQTSEVDFKPNPKNSIAERFISRVADPARRREAETVFEVLARVTRLPAKMWGPSIVGFGRYRYETPGGRESEFAMVGLAPEKKALTVYVNPDFPEFEEPLSRLGKFETGQSCIYIRDLKRVDLKALEEIVSLSVKKLKSTYKTWDD